MGSKYNGGYFKGTKGTTIKPDNYFERRSCDIPIEGEKLLKKAKSEEVKDLIRQLYRNGAKFGDGSTMAALEFQIKEGKLIGNKDHIVKSKERMRQIEKMIAKGNLNESDRKIVEKIYNRFKEAFKGEKK